MYNLTMINSSGIVPLATTVNNVLMFNQLGNLILITVFMIIVIALIRNGSSPKDSIGTASIICLIVALLLRTINWVDDFSFFVVVIIEAFSTAFLFLWKD